ncbi:MAG TPA: ABC transporter permease [Cyclobacteriaceae bacterium]|nr:ABC transporter permease [Cyclobacteriaceae bacterium]
MLISYSRTAWRSLLKNRIFSIINILGLAAGIAAFLFITTYVRFEKSYESFIPNADNTWRITLDLYNGSEYVVTDCETHAPMAPILKDRFPEVIDFVRMFNNDGLRYVQVGEKKFLESGIFFADPSVFDMFAVELVKGDAEKSWNEPFRLAISESQAIKMFGKADVVGEALTIDGNLYNISGIFRDRAANTHLKFNFLISHATLPSLRDWYKDNEWNGNNEYSYLLMKSGTDLAEFNQKVLAVSEEFKEKTGNGKYVAEPMTSIHLHSNKTFEPEANGNAKVVYFLAMIAIFIIVIAWVNYMNLATARAVERAKEVGIRKVMGSLKSQLIIQFLTESLIVNLIAGFIGLVFVQAAMPMFRELTALPSTVGQINNLSFWMMFAVLVVIGAVLAGIYPAFVLSSFRPALVLKGKFQSSSHGQLLRKALVVFQFGTTIILIVGVSVVYLQVNHLRSVDIGANLDHTLAVRAPGMDVADSVFVSKYNTFKDDVIQKSSVQSVAVSESFPGVPITELNTNSNSVVGREAQTGRYEFYWYAIDEDFVTTMGMSIRAGRNFESSSDVGNMLINEEAAKRLGFDNPEDIIGRQLTFVDWRTQKPVTVVGVIKNFYQRSPKEVHLPMTFIYSQRGRYFTFRFNATDIPGLLASVKESFENNFPGDVFNYSFVDERYDQQYRTDVQFGRVMGTFSALAVIIACLGLFGLSSYTIVQRRKEIGIRKVLGASISQVVRLLTGGYVKIVFMSSIVALPIAWLAVDNWLSSYTTRIDLNVWIFVVPVFTILFIALVTVGFQTLRSATANPAIALKQD